MNGDGQPIIIPLAQLKPAANVLTDLFTCPPGQHALIQRIVITNMSGGGAEKVSLALAQKGVPPDDKQFFYLQAFAMTASSYLVLDPAVTIDAYDVIRVQSVQGSSVFAILGHIT